MKNVARFLLPALILPVFLAAQSNANAAHAATVIDFGVGGVSSYSFLISGLDGMAGTDDASARLTLNLVSVSSGKFLFSYSLENLGGGAFDRGRLTGFGFNVSQPLLQSGSTGLFKHANSGEVVPGFSVDSCFTVTGSGCSGGATAGLGIGSAASTGTLVLTLAQPGNLVSLTDLYVSWQGLRAEELRIKNAAAIARFSYQMFEPAPEPGTWAMMIAGFGLVGAAARRRTTALDKRTLSDR